MRLKHFNTTFGVQIFKAFSDESRIRILYLLYKNERMCTSDIELILNFSQSKASRHLVFLKNSGLVNKTQINQWVFYVLKEETMDIIQQLFQYLSKDATLKKDMEHYTTLYNNRELAAFYTHKHFEQ